MKPLNFTFQSGTYTRGGSSNDKAAFRNKDFKNATLAFLNETGRWTLSTQGHAVDDSPDWFFSSEANVAGDLPWDDEKRMLGHDWTPGACTGTTATQFTLAFTVVQARAHSRVLASDSESEFQGYVPDDFDLVCRPTRTPQYEFIEVEGPTAKWGGRYWTDRQLRSSFMFAPLSCE